MGQEILIMILIGVVIKNFIDILKIENRLKKHWGDE